MNASKDYQRKCPRRSRREYTGTPADIFSYANPCWRSLSIKKKNQSGSILAIVVLVFLVGAIALVLVTSLGKIFVIGSSLQLGADAAAEAGTVQFSEIATRIASVRKQEYIDKWCAEHLFGPCPPPELPTDPLWYLAIPYLGNNDRPYLLEDQGIRSEIEQAAQTVAEKNLIHTAEKGFRITTDFEYPLIQNYDNCQSDTQVVIRVKIKAEGSIGVKVKNLVKTGVSYTSLCHS